MDHRHYSMSIHIVSNGWNCVVFSLTLRIISESRTLRPPDPARGPVYQIFYILRKFLIYLCSEIYWVKGSPFPMGNSDLLRLEASSKVRRRYLGLLVYSRYHRLRFQWTFCHTWSKVTTSGRGVYLEFHHVVKFQRDSCLECKMYDNNKC